MRIAFLLGFLIISGAAAAQSGDPHAIAGELPDGACLRPDHVEQWNVINDRTIAVGSTSGHFLVRTTVDCPHAGAGATLRFRPSQRDLTAGAGAICGGVNEQLLRPDGPPCPLQSVQAIDKDDFDHLAKSAHAHEPAAPRATSVP